MDISGFFLEGIQEAIILMISLDSDMLGIVTVSVTVALSVGSVYVSDSVGSGRVPQKKSNELGNWVWRHDPRTGKSRVVATDCDGTTWRGDIGDALFKKAVAEELLLADANPR